MKEIQELKVGSLGFFTAAFSPNLSSLRLITRHPRFRRRKRALTLTRPSCATWETILRIYKPCRRRTRTRSPVSRPGLPTAKMAPPQRRKSWWGGGVTWVSFSEMAVLTDQVLEDEIAGLQADLDAAIADVVCGARGGGFFQCRQVGDANAFRTWLNHHARRPRREPRQLRVRSVSSRGQRTPPPTAPLALRRASGWRAWRCISKGSWLKTSLTSRTTKREIDELKETVEEATTKAATAGWGMLMLIDKNNCYCSWDARECNPFDGPDKNRRKASQELATLRQQVNDLTLAKVGGLCAAMCHISLWGPYRSNSDPVERGREGT